MQMFGPAGLMCRVVPGVTGRLDVSIYVEVGFEVVDSYLEVAGFYDSCVVSADKGKIFRAKFEVAGCSHSDALREERGADGVIEAVDCVDAIDVGDAKASFLCRDVLDGSDDLVQLSSVFAEPPQLSSEPTWRLTIASRSFSMSSWTC